MARLISILQEVGQKGRKASKEAFGEAANVLISSIRAAAPQSAKPHYRYSTPKMGKRKRAPKGSGQKVATYMPGNLKRSFQILPFRRSPAVWVGAKLSKRGTGGGVFAGNRVDGFYAAMVEFGTKHAAARPYVRPTLAAVGPATLEIAKAKLAQKIQSYIRSKSRA